MEIVALQEFLDHKDFYMNEAVSGKIFVYPTDTIYGIWWIYNEENIRKVFAIKNRDEKKIFSIIVPNFDRIQKEYPQANVEILKKHLENYHGVTYIFSYEKPGIRIIKHPIQSFVEALWIPFITTSCNISWEPVVIDINNITEEIANKVDYIIDGGIWWGKPSVLIDLVANKIIER